MLPLTSDRYGSGNLGVVLIIRQTNHVKSVAVNRVGSIQFQSGEGVRLAGQLLSDLVHVVGIDVAVSAGPHEFADL